MIRTITNVVFYGLIFGFLLLFYEATEGVEGAYGTEFLPAAVAFFRDDDDAHADG